MGSSRESCALPALLIASSSVAGVVRSVASRLGLVPTQVSGAQWLPEESRWSDEPGRSDSGAGDAIAERVLGTSLTVRSPAVPRSTSRPRVRVYPRTLARRPRHGRDVPTAP